MADARDQLHGGLDGSSAGDVLEDEALEKDLTDPVTDREWAGWSNLWQVPAIALSLLLIGAGLYVAGSRRPANDFDGVLDRVDHLVAVGDFESAREQLQGVIEPNIAEATPPQAARYHATVADWIDASQRARGVSVRENNQLIDQQYRLAEGSIVLSPARLERWTNALIELRDLDEARKRMAEIEAMSVTDATAADARVRRNRLLRRLVEVSLTGEDLSFDETMAILRSYRTDTMLTPSDQAWVACRQAELLLESDDPGAAVSRLFVEMRRLEQDQAEIEPQAWTELYTLLGRGYYQQGQYDHAEYYLQQALERTDATRPERAAALLLQGRIEVARGGFETAFERFDEIVREFADTPAYLPAHLGRAEVESILGRHEDSLADYRRLLELLPSSAPRRDVHPRAIAASLADRHDAALTIGNLPLAMEYVALAEALFEAGAVPRDVLRRIASTSRQIADNLMTKAVAQLDGDPPRLEDADPQLRSEAADHYDQAGEYFLRHARALTATPEAEEQWADSLWLAGDSLDLAGDRDLAIRLFVEYIAGRPVDDPRRAEVTFRLGQAYEAQGQFQIAAETYGKVVDEHSRSTFGTQSHVPMARCLVATGAVRDAEEVLRRIVEGRQGTDTPLTPDAVDYRNALVELGKILYDEGKTRLAIERLTAAAERYPDDPRMNETRFRLADSHRSHARTLRDDLARRPGMSPQERLDQERLIRDHREKAIALFARVGDGYAALDDRRLDRLQRDYRRYAALYRADCAYDIGAYGLAAEYYDHAARQFGDHHASMHALVQIVNCFDLLGKARDADIAHQNALTRLRQLPDTAFDDPQSLMDRAAWEQWLENRPVGLVQAGSSLAPGAETP